MRTYVVLGGKNGDYILYVGNDETIASEIGEGSRYPAKFQVWENDTHLSHRDRLYPGRGE